MKIRLVVALVGLAISIALPTFAQQKDTVDPLVWGHSDASGFGGFNLKLENWPPASADK